jgi:hypothetical protein
VRDALSEEGIRHASLIRISRATHEVPERALPSTPPFDANGLEGYQARVHIAAMSTNDLHAAMGAVSAALELAGEPTSIGMAEWRSRIWAAGRVA